MPTTTKQTRANPTTEEGFRVAVQPDPVPAPCSWPLSHAVQRCLPGLALDTQFPSSWAQPGPFGLALP